MNIIKRGLNKKFDRNVPVRFYNYYYPNFLTDFHVYLSSRYEIFHQMCRNEF